MGFIKDAKAESLATEARKATEKGQTVFAARLNMPSSKATGLTGEIADWSLMIQAVEAEGWRLDTWAVAVDSKGRAEAHPLFRRAS